MGTTNGVEVSPDGKRLYVNESIQRTVWVYDLVDGLPRNKRVLHKFDDFGLDGMRCDPAGNLYIARCDGGQIAVVSPEGKLLRTVQLKGRKPSNVTFDGAQVFVTLQDRGAIETFYVEPHARGGRVCPLNRSAAGVRARTPVTAGLSGRNRHRRCWRPSEGVCHADDPTERPGRIRR